MWDRTRRKGLLRGLAVVIVLLIVGAGTVDVYAEQFFSTLPSIKGLDAANLAGDTFVYDRNGTLLADLGDQGNHRQVLKLKDISPWVPKATISIEDRNFYRNQGFDLTGIARAAYANFRHEHVVQGGSTITQQLAKSLLLTPEQTYTRKAKELILAYQISQAYSKDQILELYLNNSYYGQQAYGVEAASKVYFRKDAKDLDTAQAAMLAGLPQSPTELDPLVHPQAAKARQLEVLTAMAGQGYITQAQAQQAYGEPLDIRPPVNNFLAPHFVNYVQDELRKLGFKPGQEQLFVTTTLDYPKQQLAEQVVRDNLQRNLWRDQGGQLNSAMVALDPHTAQVIAMVGSSDFNRESGQINYVYDVYRNTGSSMKVFTYPAAIASRKVTTETEIVDGPSPLNIPQAGGAPYVVYNYDHGTHGTLPLREAWGNSLNIPAVKTEMVVGVPSVVQFARNIGTFPEAPLNGVLSTNAPLSSYGLALTLGGFPVKLIDEAHGVATMANMGVYHDLEGILTVKDSKGRVLYQANADASRRQAMDPGVAFVTAQVMSDNFNRRQIFGLNSPLHFNGHTVAAKTGTADDFKDAVTVGFTPDVATIFWMGDTLGNDHAMVRGSDAGFTIAPAFHDFMEGFLRGVPDHWYPQPSNVVRGDATQQHGWFLADQRSVPQLAGDAPKPSPSPVPSAVPPDPGAAPGPANPDESASPRPRP